MDVNATELIVFDPNINCLPTEIGNLHSLTELRIRYCQSLESIPPEIGNLIALTELSVRYCQNLKSIPPEIGNSRSLTKLDIWNCFNLESIPAEIALLMEQGCEIHSDRLDLIEKALEAYYRPRVETLDIVLKHVDLPQDVANLFANFVWG